MIVGVLVMGGVGILLGVLGYLIWVKKKISLLHAYHYDKVANEDKDIFCTVCGVGLTVIGIGAIAAAIILLLTDSLLSFIALAAGFIAGIAALIYAEVKYNSERRRSQKGV